MFFFSCKYYDTILWFIMSQLQDMYQSVPLLKISYSFNFQVKVIINNKLTLLGGIKVIFVVIFFVMFINTLGILCQ